MRPAHHVLAIASFALVAVHCSSSSHAPGETAGPDGGNPGDDGGVTPDGGQDFSCDAMPDAHCDNAINRVLVPMLRAAGIPIRDAKPEEFCRRAFVDLIGRIPSTDELDACRARSPGDAIDALMHMPEYAVTQARWWGEPLGYDLNFRDWYLDVYDIDALIRTAYAVDQPLPYAELAARIVMHPAFYGARQGDDWAKYIWQIFLGRTARLDEVQSFRPLSTIWSVRSTFCDGTLWWESMYAPQGGATNICDVNNGYPVSEWGADFCLCDPTQTALGCKTTVLGKPVDFGSAGCVRLDDPGNMVNFVRLTDHPAGAHTTTCPDGSSHAECQDRYFDPNSLAIVGPLTPAPAPSQAQAAHLHQLGDALAARPDFWETGANRELRRFVGWWQQGVRIPDYDIPAVREALAAQLQKTGSLPAIQKILLTSLLYDAPADAPDGVTTPPLWSMGPSKFLAAEMWLDSAATATLGQRAGVCDYRFLMGGQVGVYDGYLPNTYGAYVDTKLVDKATAQPLAGKGFDAFAFYDYAQKLGGCNADAARPNASSVGVTYAQHDLAQILCAYGGAFQPQGFDPSDSSDTALGSAVSAMVKRAWSRDATPDEVAALVADMKLCLAAQDGCAGSVDAAVRWMCARVIDSAPFALY